MSWYIPITSLGWERLVESQSGFRSPPEQPHLVCVPCLSSQLEQGALGRAVGVPAHLLWRPSIPLSSDHPDLRSTLADNLQYSFRAMQGGSPSSLETVGPLRALHDWLQQQDPKHPVSSQYGAPCAPQRSTAHQNHLPSAPARGRKRTAWDQRASEQGGPGPSKALLCPHLQLAEGVRLHAASVQKKKKFAR